LNSIIIFNDTKFDRRSNFGDILAKVPPSSQASFQPPQHVLCWGVNNPQEVIMKKFILSLALLGFAGAPALAQEADFMKVDANADGLVSMEEAAAAGWEWTEDQFKTVDVDGDGSLNAEEFAAAAG